MHVFPDAPFVDTSRLEPPPPTFFVRSFDAASSPLFLSTFLSRHLCRKTGTRPRAHASWNPLHSTAELCLHSGTTDRNRSVCKHRRRCSTTHRASVSSAYNSRCRFVKSIHLWQGLGVIRCSCDYAAGNGHRRAGRTRNKHRAGCRCVKKSNTHIATDHCSIHV